jgi:hypothetical protein
MTGPAFGMYTVQVEDVATEQGGLGERSAIPNLDSPHDVVRQTSSPRFGLTAALLVVV